MGRGNRAGPNLTSSGDGADLGPLLRKPWAVGGKSRGGERTDRRQDQSYVQVRPTFHQSKTDSFYFYAKV